MAKNPGIKIEILLNVIKEFPTLKIEDKKNWIKVYRDGNPNRMYLARGKELCRQVDFSGPPNGDQLPWAKGQEGTLPLKAPNGQVHAHLDIGHADVENNFRALCALFAGGDAFTEAPRKFGERKKPEASSPPVVSSSPDGDPKVLELPRLSAEELEERKADAAARRRALIEQVAREKGVGVSDKAIGG